jgi:uncharacterized membrane protein
MIYGCQWFGCSFWWIFPMVMIFLCILMMRGRRGRMTRGFWPCGFGSNRMWSDDSAKGILEKRYAKGEIDRKQYDEMISVLAEDQENNKD